MNPNWTFSLYNDVVVPAAKRVAPLVKKYGWDVEDCLQAAAEWLLVNGPAKLDPAYITVCIRRHILRSARPSDARINAERSYISRMAERTYAPGGAVVDFQDLVESAPPAVRDWLRVRVLDGATWDEACEGLGWSRAYAATVRAAAAEWLLQQFEGVAK